MEIKLATTIEEQIERLKQRGMTIDDESAVKEALSDIGYYRLGFYWFPLEVSYPERENRDHKFKEDANFSTCLHLYEFDRDIRNILSSYLMDIEVNFRTKVIYIVSNIYKDNPTWFADNKVVMSAYISQFEKKYKQEVSNNDVIKRHSKKHINDKYAPAWKTLEYLSFGDLIRLVENIKNSETKAKIYSEYGFNEDKTFPNYIDVVRTLRNYCAHGHPVYDLILSKSIRAGKLKNVLKGKELQKDFYSSLQGALLVIQYLLYYLPNNKGERFKNDMEKFLDKMENDIMPFVGYLKDTPWLAGKI